MVLRRSVRILLSWYCDFQFAFCCHGITTFKFPSQCLLSLVKYGREYASGLLASTITALLVLGEISSYYYKKECLSNTCTSFKKILRAPTNVKAVYARMTEMIQKKTSLTSNQI